MSRVDAIRIGLLAGSLLTGNIVGWSQEASHDVDVLFADLTRPDSPGGAVGIYREGKIIYAKAARRCSQFGKGASPLL
jgi:hypothetical protein